MVPSYQSGPSSLSCRDTVSGYSRNMRLETHFPVPLQSQLRIHAGDGSRAWDRSVPVSEESRCGENYVEGHRGRVASHQTRRETEVSLRYEFTSALLRFVDDVEFVF